MHNSLQINKTLFQTAEDGLMDLAWGWRLHQITTTEMVI